MVRLNIYSVLVIEYMPLSLDEYKSLLSDIIAKQVVVLGPDVAILKARNVSSLVIDDKGVVSDIIGDGDVAVRELINVYVQLSGQIVQNTLHSVFEKYPALTKAS